MHANKEEDVWRHQEAKHTPPPPPSPEVLKAQSEDRKRKDEELERQMEKEEMRVEADRGRIMLERVHRGETADGDHHQDKHHKMEKRGAGKYDSFREKYGVRRPKYSKDPESLGEIEEMRSDKGRIVGEIIEAAAKADAAEAEKPILKKPEQQQQQGAPQPQQKQNPAPPQAMTKGTGPSSGAPSVAESKATVPIEALKNSLRPTQQHAKRSPIPNKKDVTKYTDNYLPHSGVNIAELSDNQGSATNKGGNRSSHPAQTNAEFRKSLPKLNALKNTPSPSVNSGSGGMDYVKGSFGNEYGMGGEDGILGIGGPDGVLSEFVLLGKEVGEDVAQGATEVVGDVVPDGFEGVNLGREHLEKAVGGEA